MKLTRDDKINLMRVRTSCSRTERKSLDKLKTLATMSIVKYCWNRIKWWWEK